MMRRRILYWKNKLCAMNNYASTLAVYSVFLCISKKSFIAFFSFFFMRCSNFCLVAVLLPEIAIFIL